MLRTDWPAQAAANQNQPGGDQPVPDDYTTDSTPHDISTSDFIIMQSSFDCKLHIIIFQLFQKTIYLSIICLHL